jgi:hypothetical protein
MSALKINSLVLSKVVNELLGKLLIDVLGDGDHFMSAACPDILVGHHSYEYSSRLSTIHCSVGSVRVLAASQSQSCPLPL